MLRFTLLMVVLLAACGEQADHEVPDESDVAGASPPDAVEIPSLQDLEPAAGPDESTILDSEYETASVDIGYSAAANVDAPVLASAEDVTEEASAESENTVDIDSYKVEIGVDEYLKKPGPAGELIVWIGDPRYKKQFQPGMATDSTYVPAIGETAKVTPFAPDFDVSPAGSKCISIHIRGSDVRFTITPRSTGTFEVGASVELYQSDDCSGAPVPQVVDNLVVEVTVDDDAVFDNRIAELLAIAWEKFLEFWAAFLVLFFGLILFLFRRQLKKWFGYSGDE